MNIIRSILGCKRRHDIAFHSNGRIDIASRIVKALEIGPGDVIDIATANGEFWLYVDVRASDACGKYEARCFPTKARSHNFRAWSRRLCSAFIKNNDCARFASGDVDMINGKMAVNIITRLNIPR